MLAFVIKGTFLQRKVLENGGDLKAGDGGEDPLHGGSYFSIFSKDSVFLFKTYLEKACLFSI